MHYVKTGKRPHMSDLPTSAHSLALIRNFHLLSTEEGILKRKVTIDGECRKQIIVPKDTIPVVLKSLHNDFGHQGRRRDRVTLLIRDRFYWNGMNSKIDGSRIAIDVYVERFQKTSKHLFCQYRHPTP